MQVLALGDVLREHARSRPQHVATVDGVVRLTYPELDARVDRAAGALEHAGVGPGGRVLWLGQNSFRVLELLLAAARLEAMFCPANWRQSAEELAFVIDDLAPSVVVWQEAETGAAIGEARRQTGGPGHWIQHDGDGDASYEALVAAARPVEPRAVDPAAALLLLYTAAWAGRPNAAMLSHTAVITQGLVMGPLTDQGAETVYLNSGPLFHLGTLMNTFATFVGGGTNVFTPRVDAEALCGLIDAERCTGAFIVGPTYDEMIAVNRDRRYDLSSLRAYPGKPEWNEMVSLDASRWARRPGGYGQTETMGMLTFTTFGLDAIGTHGRPSPAVQVRILDPEGNDVPDGEVGEIAARGPTVMNGYWNRPDENARRQAGGWHRTNDLGRREVDGSISFIGPRTRMIKSAAENIYPAEVEGAIATHPGVAQCAVIGVPDDRWTQSVKAIVVLRAGATTTAAELVEHCRARIASYKKPRSIEFVEELPRTGFAVDYDALDARFGGGGYPGGTNRVV